MLTANRLTFLFGSIAASASMQAPFAFAAKESAMANTIPSVKLNNGLSVPQLGAGTFTLKDETCSNCVKFAAQHGYRLFDSAQDYGNEVAVARGLELSGIDRNEFFVTSKISPRAMREGTVRKSIEESLSAFGGKLDLMLIHWPVKEKIRETWEIMESFVDDGKLRAIGVSNFNPHHLEELLGYARIRPVLNQIEIHPYMTQQEVVGKTFAMGVQVQGWAPLAQGGSVLKDPTIAAIADAHKKSIAQIILRWNIERGLIAIPRCDNRDYVLENLDIFDFELSPVEIQIINGLNRNERTNAKNDPESFPW